MSEEFDLRDALLGRKYPELTKKIWLDEETWYQLAALEEKHAGMKKNDPEFERTEQRITALQERLEEEAYKVTVRGISPRAGEDIISLALSEFPFKRDMYGRDDDMQQIRRTRLIGELSFAAHLVSVTDPNGRTQVATEDNRRDLARAILGEAPKSAIAIIDAAIASVSKDFAEKQAEYANVDF